MKNYVSSVLTKLGLQRRTQAAAVAVRRADERGRLGMLPAMTEGQDARRVLVIDDAEAMRTVIRRALAADGYHVDDVATVAEARARDPYTYQAILTDVRLGQELGTDFVREMVAAAPDMAGRCLVISGGTSDAIPGGVAWLAKPFTPDQLRAAVRALLRTRHDGQQVAEKSREPVDPPAAPPETTVGAGTGKELLAVIRLARGRERQDLADRLHDGPVQALSAAALGLHLLRKRSAGEPADRLETAIRQVDQAAAALRDLMRELEQGGIPGEDPPEPALPIS